MKSTSQGGRASSEWFVSPSPRGPPVEVALAAIWRWGERGAEVLLTRRRPGSHLAGLWELPGGRIEAGESPGQAARRELREETGLDVEGLEPLVVVEHRYPDRAVRLHALLAPCEAAAPREGIEHAWVPVGRLDTLRCPPANAPIHAALRSRLAMGGMGQRS